MLYRTFPKADEGELSKRWPTSCARRAARRRKSLGLVDDIKARRGRGRRQCRLRTSVLGDICEAWDRRGVFSMGVAAAAQSSNATDRADEEAAAANARSEDGAAGMGARQRLADAGSIARSSARGRSRSAISCRRGFAGLAPAKGSAGSKRGREKVAASVMIAREGVGGASNEW